MARLFACAAYRGRVTLLISVVLWLVGCHSRTRQDYIPSPARCEAALSSALEAWQRGEPPGRIEGTPAVQVGDSLRLAGQKLAAYEILGELPSDEGRRYAVRVKFENPAVQEKIHFILVGIDPIWVLRQEDFDVVTHWEHRMTKNTEPSGKK